MRAVDLANGWQIGTAGKLGYEQLMGQLEMIGMSFDECLSKTEVKPGMSEALKNGQDLNEHFRQCNKAGKKFNLDEWIVAHGSR